MSTTAASPDVAAESEEVAKQEECQFVVIHDNRGRGEIFEATDDREDAESLAQAHHIIDGLRYYIAERVTTFGGSNGQPVAASTPATDVAVPEAHFGLSSRHSRFA